VLDQGPEKRMARVARLDHDFAALAAAAGAARHLREHGVKALGGAIVRGKQSGVRVQHGDERQLRKVVSLGEQLRANQDVAFAAPQPLERAHELGAPACAVTIDAHDARAGKACRERLLHALCAAAHRFEVHVAAGRARARDAFLRTAVMQRRRRSAA